jgi:hypothetical protein
MALTSFLLPVFTPGGVAPTASSLLVDEAGVAASGFCEGSCVLLVSLA